MEAIHSTIKANKTKMTKLPSKIQPKRNDTRGFLIFFVIMFLWSAPTTSALGKDYSFNWSANPEPVTGYKIYYNKGGNAGPPFNGTDSSAGPSPVNVGKTTSFAITGLQDNTTYHFAVTAYNSTTESDFSQVITVLPAGSTPTPALPAPTIMGIKIVNLGTQY